MEEEKLDTTLRQLHDVEKVWYKWNSAMERLGFATGEEILSLVGIHKLGMYPEISNQICHLKEELRCRS